MRRRLTTTLCFALLQLLGCEDEGTPSDAALASDGGGIDLGPLQGRIGALEDDVAELDDRADGFDSRIHELAGTVADASMAIDELSEQVASHDDRLDALEEPEPCSWAEPCPGDAVAAILETFGPIIEAACEEMVSCCTPGELDERFSGSGGAEACVSLITDGVERGRVLFAPSPLTFQVTLLPMMRALTMGSIELIPDSSVIERCVDSIAESGCIGYATPPAECSPLPPSPYEDCRLVGVVRGLRAAGEPCSAEMASREMDECGEGLACRVWHPGFQEASWQGVCTPVASVGDACVSDIDCNHVDDLAIFRPVNDLFCNPHTRACEQLRDEGMACELDQDQFFEVVDCARGLFCHPGTGKCAPRCSEGTPCGGGGSWDVCDPGLTCVSPSGPGWSGMVCAKPYELGELCDEPTQCESGFCRYDPAAERELCTPAPAAPGSACILGTPGVDFGCVGDWCSSLGECAALCDEDVPCAADRVCLETSQGPRCEAALADGEDCLDPVGPGTLDDACASGFCDGATCAAQADAGGPCPSGRKEECPSGQYCDDGTCADVLAAGVSCSVDDACGPGAYCPAAGPSAGVCRVAGSTGEPCDAEADLRCADGLDCVDIGEANACHAPSAYPNGAACLYDELCADGWCSQGACRALLGAGDACEAEDSDAYRCAPELYCTGGACAGPSTCTAWW